MFWETSNIMIIYNPLYHNMSVTGVKYLKIRNLQVKDKHPLMRVCVKMLSSLNMMNVIFKQDVGS